MGLQFVVGLSYQRVHVGIRILENQRRMNLLVSVLTDTDNRAFANFRKLIQHVLDIFRMNVEPFRCDDHVLLAATIVQTAFRIHRAKIARVKPATIVAGSDTFAADENLAIGRNHHFEPRQGPAKRSSFRVERMIDRDNRACLC